MYRKCSESFISIWILSCFKSWWSLPKVSFFFSIWCIANRTTHAHIPPSWVITYQPYMNRWLNDFIFVEKYWRASTFNVMRCNSSNERKKKTIFCTSYFIIVMIVKSIVISQSDCIQFCSWFICNVKIADCTIVETNPTR